MVSTAAQPEETQPAARIGFVMTALLTTMLMSSLGQMIFATALPTIVGELGGVDKMSWVISAFLVMMTTAMPIFGKVGDLIGRKYLYLTGIGIFLIGSTLGGFAHTMTLLIIGRAIQGFGAGGMMVTSQSILAEVVPARQRGKFMGIMGAVFGVSSVLGPVLGGWFTDGPGWRWGLWMNIPLGIIALIISASVLHLRKGNGEQRRYDWLGTVFLALFTSSLILTTTWGGTQYPWGSGRIIGLGITAAVAAVAFVLTELKASEPLIPMRMFRNRNMSLTTMAGIVLGVAMAGALGYMPTYLQMVHALTPTEAGLMMIPMMAGMIITSTSVGNMITRTGNYKIYPIIGMIIVAISLWLMSRFHASSSLTHVGVVLFFFGFGLGMVIQVLVMIVQNSFPIRMVGTATAANNFFRQVGASVGASLVGSLFVHNMRNNLQENLPAAIAKMGPAGAPYAAQFSNASGKGANSLTPQMVLSMPEPIKQVILNAYNDGLTPIFAAMVPLAIISMLLLIPVKEEQLKETID